MAKTTDLDRGYKLFIRKRKGGIAVTYCVPKLLPPKDPGASEWIKSPNGAGVIKNLDTEETFGWVQMWEKWLSPEVLATRPLSYSYEEKQYYLGLFDSLLKPNTTERLSHAYLVTDRIADRISKLLDNN